MPFDNLEGSPLNFTVTEKPVEIKVAGEYVNADGWKALMRRHPSTGEPVTLHVVKDSYKVIQTKELFGAVDTTIRDQFGEWAEGAIVRDRTSYLGAFCQREYHLPKLKAEIEEKKVGTTVGFRILTSTSFDGSSAVKVLSGCLDLRCTNGAVAWEFDQIIQRHTKNADVVLGGIADRLKASIDVFWRYADTLKQWARKEITDEIAEEVLKKFGFSEARQKAIMAQYQIEVAGRGRTVWALYSALTYYATHSAGAFQVRNTGNDAVAATLQKREMEVLRLTRSNEWRSLAA